MLKVCMECLEDVYQIQNVKIVQKQNSIKILEIGM